MPKPRKKLDNSLSVEAALPSWVGELATAAKSGVAKVFILAADVNNLTANPDADRGEERYIPLKSYLAKMFDGAVDNGGMRIFYNISSGVYFLTPEEEDRFRQITGLVSSDSAVAGDPIAAAKNKLNKKKPLPREPEICLPLIERCLRTQTNMAVIIYSVHSITPSAAGGVAPAINDRINSETLKNWANSEQIGQRGNMVLLITDQLSKVSLELRQSGTYSVKISKPKKEERLDFINWRLNQDPDIKLTDFTINEFVVATQGMSFRQIYDIFLYAKENNDKLSLNDIKKKKIEILNAEYGDVLEVVDPQLGLENIGGLEYIKEYLERVLDDIRKGRKNLVPMGVLFMGPPGTGKTALVEALAKEAGFNFVKIKNVRSMWVGESEARMEILVSALWALAPVVVMNDEADLAEAGRDDPKGDAGVSARIMKMWMELLSNPKIRGEVIVISCTNRPDRLDPALKRSGRTDDRFLLPMPSDEERKKIFEVMFKRYQIETSIQEFTEFSKLTTGLSGANIEDIVTKSARFASEQGEVVVSEDALSAAIADFIPSASQKDIDLMTMLGLLESSSRRRQPPHIKEILAGIFSRNLVPELSEMARSIEERKIVDISDIKNLLITSSISPSFIN